MTIELDEEQHKRLIMALAMATSCAMQQHDRELAYSFVELANAVNRNNPAWRPYVLPDDKS